MLGFLATIRIPECRVRCRVLVRSVVSARFAIRLTYGRVCLVLTVSYGRGLLVRCPRRVVTLCLVRWSLARNR